MQVEPFSHGLGANFTGKTQILNNFDIFFFWVMNSKLTKVPVKEIMKMPAQDVEIT